MGGTPGGRHGAIGYDAATTTGTGDPAGECWLPGDPSDTENEDEARKWLQVYTDLTAAVERYQRDCPELLAPLSEKWRRRRNFWEHRLTRILIERRTRLR